MKYLRFFILILLGAPVLYAADIVEVTATLVKVNHANPRDLSQLELRQEVVISRSRGSEDLLKLSAVVESGKWATIKRGREFWYPVEYSKARVYRSPKDDGTYSIPEAGPATGNSTIVLPNSPTRMGQINLGAELQVRPTVKPDGLIYLEGRFKDIVFEGLSEETIPIKVETKQLVKQKRVHEIMTSRIDKPVFRTVDEEFGVMLPYSAGTSAAARQLREAKSKYTYLIPIVLGNTAFGAPGKIELKSDSPAAGPIKSTVMKATMVKDFFIRKKTEDTRRENGILILEVKKIASPEPVPYGGKQEKQIYLTSRFLESESPGFTGNPVLNDGEFEAVMRKISSKKGTDLMSAPSIVTRPGEAGRIEVIREFIFPTDYQPSALGSRANSKGFPVTPATPSKFETRDVGVTIDVNAALVEKDMIRMKIKTAIVTFEGFLDFGNPIMAVKSGMLKKLKPVVASENRVEMPVFPFRSTETELLVPNGQTVAVTMIFDYHNINHQKDRILRLGKARVEEVKTPRYLTVFLSPKIMDQAGNP